MHTRQDVGVAGTPRGVAAGRKKCGGRLAVVGLGLVVLLAFNPPTPAATVYLEDSAAARELADEAERLMSEGRAGEAAQRLHRIIEAYPEKLMPWGEDLYTDARLWVRDRLGSDPALRQAYRNRFGGEAQRALDDAVALPGPDAELQVRWVWQTYTWTPAGLDAALWLAGAHLERADTDGAAAPLESLSLHPDLTDRAVTYYELRAWAAALAGLDRDVEQMLEALRGLTQSDRADALASTLDDLQRPGDGTGAGRAHPFTPPPLDRALWEVEIVDAAESAQAAMLRNRSPQLARNLISDLRPVASDALLLFNDTQRLFALDRTSGRLRWVYRPDPSDNEANDDPQAMRRARQIALGRSVPDPRQVLVSGNSAYGVVGNVTSLRGQRRGQTIPTTRLVSVDTATGASRWAVTPATLDPALARASFHGTPVACGGQIIVMARRSQASSFQDSYLMSVDAATGELRWRRHLASTAGANQRNSITALSSMTLDGQRLYFSDNLGAAAAVDALTGTVRWVRVLDAPTAGVVDRRAQAQRSVTPLSGTGQPIPSPAGLILPLRIAEDRGLLLDPDTGHIRKRFADDAPIAEAGDIHPLPGGDLLTTGATYRRLDGQTLEPRWSRPAPDGQTIEDAAVSVLSGGDTAIVSVTPHRFDELDLVTGEIRRRHAVPQAGHVIAFDHAWVVSSGSRVSSYLDWPIAYRELSRRAAENPASVVPGLSMATLALNAQRNDALNEGINRALSALALLPTGDGGPASTDARGRVFRELLALTEKPKSVEPAIIEALFDRLATITDTPGELVAYNLARGEFLEGHGRLAEATDYYQAVLLDPRLSDELWSRNQSSRRADLVARQRLLDMLEAHGRAFYEDFDAKAQRQLVTLKFDPTTKAQDLRDLVRRYPLARVAAEATLEAAELQAKSTTHAGAAVQYRRAFQLADDDAIRARAAGALAKYHEDQGHPEAAIAWLESLQRRYPDIQPQRDGLPQPVDGWLEELGRAESAPRLTAGLAMPLGQAVRLKGSLVRYHSQFGVPGSTQTLLLRVQPGRLSLFDVTTQQPRWEVAEPAQSTTLVHLGQDNLILWSRTDRKLHGLDAATGRALWPPIPVPGLLEELGEGGLASTRRANAGQIIELIEADFGPLRRNNNAALAARNARTTPTVVAGEAVVCIVDAQGRAVGIDRYTGRVLWQSALALDTVNQIAVGAEVLAVGGLAAPGTEAQAGRVLLLDQFTGRLRFPVIEDDQPPNWLGLSPDRGLAVASENRLTLIDTDHGATRWRIDLPPRSGKRQIVLSRDAVFIADNTGMKSMDLVTGDPRAAIGLPHQNAQLKAHRDGVVGLIHDGALSNSCVFFDTDLNVRWRDVVQLDQKRFLRLELGQHHAFAVQLDRQRERARLSLFALELGTGRLIAQHTFTELLPNPVPTDLRVLSNHLLLAGRDWVLLIPGSMPE